MTAPKSKPLAVEACVQMRLAHLNMIQAVILRMSGFSATVKNFAATVSAGIIALAYQQHVPVLLLFAAGFTVAFACLDAYYLGLERGFRKFYDEVALRDLADAANLHIGLSPTHRAGSFRALAAFSVVGYYAPFFMVILFLGLMRCP